MAGIAPTPSVPRTVLSSRFIGIKTGIRQCHARVRTVQHGTAGDARFSPFLAGWFRTEPKAIIPFGADSWISTSTPPPGWEAEDMSPVSIIPPYRHGCRSFPAVSCRAERTVAAGWVAAGVRGETRTRVRHLMRLDWDHLQLPRHLYAQPELHRGAVYSGTFPPRWTFRTFTPCPACGTFRNYWRAAFTGRSLQRREYEATIFNPWSEIPDSNRHSQLGRLECYQLHQFRIYPAQGTCTPAPGDCWRSRSSRRDPYRFVIL